MEKAEIKISQTVLKAAGYTNLSIKAGDGLLDKEELREIKTKARKELDELKQDLIEKNNSILEEHFSDTQARADLLKMIDEVVSEQTSVPVADTAQATTEKKYEQNKSEEKNDKQKIVASPIMNYIRALELGLIGGTPKETLASIGPIKGNGIIKGTFKGLKTVTNHTTPKAMNIMSYLNTHPWIRPDLEYVISLEQATIKGLLNNRNIVDAAAKNLELRGNALNSIESALKSGDGALFSRLLKEYQESSFGRTKVAMKVSAINDRMKDSLGDVEKHHTEKKTKAIEGKTKAETKINELDVELKKLDKDIKKETKIKAEHDWELTQKRKQLTDETAKKTVLKTSHDSTLASYNELNNKLIELSDGSYETTQIKHTKEAIVAKELQITEIDTKIKATKVTAKIKDQLKDEKTILLQQKEKLESELRTIYGKEEARLQREITSHKSKMERIETDMTRIDEKINTLNTEITATERKSRQSQTEIDDFQTKKTDIDTPSTGEKAKNEVELETKKLEITQHEKLLKIKAQLEKELSLPHPNREIIKKLNTEYKKLNGSPINIKKDGPRENSERILKTEKAEFEFAKTDVERLDKVLLDIEKDINVKMAEIEGDLKSGKITKSEALKKVDNLMCGHNNTISELQKTTLTTLERLNSANFKILLGQSKWLQTINKGNALMDKVDGKFGKFAGVAIMSFFAWNLAKDGWTEELKNDLTDAGIGCIPVVGGVHDLRIAYNGVDLNNRKVEGWNRAGRVAFGIVGLVPIGGVIKAAGKITTTLAKTSVKIANAGEKMVHAGEASLRVLEPVRLVGRGAIYTTLGVEVGMGLMNMLPNSRPDNKH